MSPYPLISAVCPTTASRLEYLPTSVQLFQNQQYPNKELVIISEDDVSSVIPDDPRIRLVKCQPGLSLGRKRNLVAQAAAGEIISHWDDDDFYHPSRLAEQSQTLTKQKPVTGYHTIRFFNVIDGKARKFVYWDTNLALGTSLTYHRNVLNSIHFEDLSKGEDSLWVISVKDLIFNTDGSDRCIALDHDGNTCPRIYTSSYSPIDADETTRLMKLWSSHK